MSAHDTVRLSWEDPSTGDELRWVGRLPVRIGRGPENDLPLNAAAVSRRHARLERAGGDIKLVDEGSTNGTFVDGGRVATAPLADGGTFAIGPFTLRLELAPALTEEAAAGPATLCLRWVDPVSGSARELAIDRPVTIGRSPDTGIPLLGDGVSRLHAVVTPASGGATIADQGSANGTRINGTPVQTAALKAGDTIDIGRVTLHVERVAAVAEPARVGATQFVVVADGAQADTTIAPATPVAAAPATTVVPSVPRPAEGGPAVVLDRRSDLPSARPMPAFPPAIFRAPYVPVAQLGALGLPVDEAVYLAIGGGHGSFAWADHLIVHGAKPGAIASIGLEDKSYGRYARLCRNSQIPTHERLRSNSDSCPDNLWGWPGYAVREAFAALRQGRVGHAGGLLWQIFNEAAFADTYTPRSGDVFRAIDREAARIGWPQIWRYGRARAIRKTDDGRYVVAYSASTPQNPADHRLFLARYVHVAIGYPGIRLLPDLQRYRTTTGDFKTVVNAYEEHEHLYQQLLRQGGVVLLRGRGIVASRILQRLWELRRQNPRIGVLHLMRTPVAEGHRFGRSQREVISHWEYQPFNWPKACWTGEYLFLLEQASDQERDQLLNDWGGTTTARRRDWVRIIEEGQREGWYQIRFGDVREVRRDPGGKLVTTLVSNGLVREASELEADCVIDCTGLEATVDAHPLLKDLVEHHGLNRNPKGRLRVSNDFEVVGMENGAGHMFAAGPMTLGGPHAAVDSFLGLQYAALASTRALARLRAPGVRRLNVITSPIQWLKWAVGARP